MLRNYMYSLNKKYHRICASVACCVATFIAAPVLAPGAQAATLNERIRPLLELDDARRLLARRKDPGQLVALAAGSPSRYVRREAQVSLAGHYAQVRDWPAYREVADFAGPCASLLEAVHRRGPDEIAERVGAALASDPRDETCKEALKAASAAGFLRDDRVWRQIRVLVDGRKSRTARALLPLLKDDRASSEQLNKAIQDATRRIRGKHGLDTRAEEELLAVSAVVAARRDALMVGRRWEQFAPYISDDIERQVWTIVGKHASLDHHAREALGFYRRVPIEEHGRFELAWRARAAIRARDWKEVQQSTAAMTGEQATLPDWRFWNAYALSRLDSKEAAWDAMVAVAQNHDSFYGLVARSLTGRALRTGRHRPDPAAAAGLAGDVDFRMAVALGTSGNTVRARKIWRFLNSGMSGGELLAAAKLAEDEGWYLGSINAADRAAAEAPSHELRFPVPHLDTVRGYTDRFGVDPAFAYAIMRQESRFNPRALSSAGARGLMQVMPATGRAVARKHGYTRYNTSRLFLLETNVIIGTRYIADLHGSVGQDPILVAATYNAGPKNVNRWRRSSRGVDKLAFIETIPFTETRLYVKHVMANMAHYDLRFDSAIKPWHEWLEGRY